MSTFQKLFYGLCVVLFVLSLGIAIQLGMVIEIVRSERNTSVPAVEPTVVSPTTLPVTPTAMPTTLPALMPTSTPAW